MKHRSNPATSPPPLSGARNNVCDVCNGRLTGGHEPLHPAVHREHPRGRQRGRCCTWPEVPRRPRRAGPAPEACSPSPSGDRRTSPATPGDRGESRRGGAVRKGGAGARTGRHAGVLAPYPSSALEVRWACAWVCLCCVCRLYSTIQVKVYV